MSKNTCDECGGPVSDLRTIRCIKCVSAEASVRRTCPRCGGKKYIESTHCRRCSYEVMHEATDEGRICIDCGEFKPWDSFRDRNGVAGYQNDKMPRCEPCYVAYFRRYYLWREYKITEEQYDDLVEQQGGRCANPRCDATSPGHTFDYWLVDHDHDTGAVRALLCHDCNIALGQLRDSPEKILGLYEYIVEHRQLRLVGGQ